MSQSVNIVLKGDNCWPELTDGRVIHHEDKSKSVGFAFLANGTHSGAPVVFLRIDCEDGSTALAEVTGNNLWNVAMAMRAKFPELFL